MSATITPEATAAAAVTAWVDDFAGFDRARTAREPAAVRALRRRAIERFGERGFPGRREEQWRFTDVSAIAATRFARAAGPGAVDAAALAPSRIDGAIRLVVVDGFVVPALSDLAALPAGTRLGSLADALAEAPERVEEHLGRHARFDDHPFVALNTAFFADGVLLALPARAEVETPIHLVFYSTAGSAEAPPASFPRTLIVAGEASRATVVESYVGTADAVYLTCPVTELAMAPGAVIDHCKLQHDSRQAFHLATLQVHQERAGNLFSHAVSSGAALARNDVNAVLAGEGCDCTLNGLYLASGSQHVDNHMRMDHVAPHCTSYELYKGVLDGHARSVFNGLIHVHPGAQKTDAKQSNRNLLLSEGAMANSNPQLEIFADDVRCTHGSTVGQLDEDAVFYLRSRGIGAEAATSLLTYAFASDIVGRIRIEPVRRDLEELLFSRLPRGEVVRQAV
jgi:Fe-S cluster assembly protein SufD